MALEGAQSVECLNVKDLTVKYLRGDGVTAISFQNSLDLSGGQSIILNSSSGNNIGTATSQKIGFYGVTPVDQPTTVSDPSGGATQDAEARTAIEAIIDRLQELGLIA